MLVGTCNQKKALVEAFSVIVKLCFPALVGNGLNTAPAGNTRHYSHGQLQCSDQSWGHQLGSLLPSITGQK